MWINSFETEPYGNRGLYFYESLETNAPSEAQPYCYLIGQVAFYKLPYRSDGKGGYAKYDDIRCQWDLLGHRWTNEDIGFASLAPLVSHDGQLYELATGSVIWRNGRWFKRWLGWRLPLDDRRLPSIRQLYPILGDI